MLWGDAQLMKHLQVQFGRIAFMAGELIARIEPVQDLHFLVPGDLGQYRSRRNFGDGQIALNDGFAGAGNVGIEFSVD